MFDGSHRSRRTIDLGGNKNARRQARGRAGSGRTSFLTRTTGVTGVPDQRAQVLESTRRLRQERHQQLLRQTSARKLQASYRGWRTRKHLSATLCHSTTNNPTLVLSLRLSRPLRPFLSQEATQQALLEYERQMSQESASSMQRTLTSLASRRIALAALPLLETNPATFLQLTKNVVESTSFVWDVSTFGAVATACQDWLWKDNDATLFPTTDDLWKWTCQAAASLGTTEALALVGSTVFCTTAATSRPWHPHPVHASFGVSGKDAEAWTRDVLLTSLVDTLLVKHRHNELVRLCQDRVAGREGILLANALVLCRHRPSASLLHLLQHLLRQRPALLAVTTLVVRGDNVKEWILNSSNPTSSSTPMEVVSEHGLEESDDESSDLDTEGPRSRVPTTYKTQSSTFRLTRQELQTVPKLDRLYQEQVSRYQKDCLQDLQSSSNDDKTLLVALAEQIGDAALWKDWGLSILAHAAQEPAAAYLTVLGMLLQSSIGLKVTRSTSKFVSQLAFSKPFLEALWRRVLVLVVNGGEPGGDVNVGLPAMTLFADLFSHHLMALSDEEFLQQYTTARGSQVILAEHVITQLRSMLYEVYWSKPVVASDVIVGTLAASEEGRCKGQRACFLLSGTKLFGFLYERWCRLVRQSPFCDESTWLFPRLVSRDEHGPVVTVRDAGGNDDDNESVVSMDTDDDDETGGAVGVSRAEEETDALADSFRDPKMARILTCIPFVLPFDRRVKLFNSLLSADKLKTQDETQEFRQAMMRMAAQGRDFDDEVGMSVRERVQIRRDALYEDSMGTLNNLGKRLKKKVQVTFINQHGAEEAGIDGGGVFKEFLDDLIKEAFDPSRGQAGALQLFSITPSQMLTVDMATPQTAEVLAHYEFLGRVLGKAVYESVLVEPQFCLPFLNQLLGKQNSLEDLRNLDAEYYTNLTKLRTLSDSDIDNLGLTFELTFMTGNRRRTIELLPGGSSIPVTKDNVILYVHQVAHQRLNVQGARPTRAFLQGFRDLIPASWVRLFSAYELQKLISGDDTVKGIDIQGLKASINYAGGYHPSQPIVQWFWEVLEELTVTQQRQFLRFMTSCSRQPLLGFQALEPPPCIQQIRIPEEYFLSEEATKGVPLPTSATCMNLLKLPNYRTKELLRKKLLDSIESGAGFELT